MHVTPDPESAGTNEHRRIEIEFERRRIEFKRRAFKYAMASREGSFRKVLLLMWVIGPACALIGYALTWSIGLSDLRRAHFTAGAYLVGTIMAALVMVWRSTRDV
jgi:hypothetical protein